MGTEPEVRPAPDRCAAVDTLVLGAAMLLGIVLLAVVDGGVLRPDQFEEIE